MQDRKDANCLTLPENLYNPLRREKNHTLFPAYLGICELHGAAAIPQASLLSLALTNCEDLGLVLN